jgi:hypothetical protein
MNMNTISTAVSLLGKYKNIRIQRFTCTPEKHSGFNVNISDLQPATFAGTGIYYRLEATVARDCETVDIEYRISEEDLTDQSAVNAAIGRIDTQPKEMREALRLAYILYDGVKLAAGGRAGGYPHPRVVKIERRFEC